MSLCTALYSVAYRLGRQRFDAPLRRSWLSGDWTVTTPGSGVVTYQRTGDADAVAENVVVDIGDDGLLISISLEQRPTGARPENPLFYRTTITFEDLGATVVDVPSDLSSD